MLKVSLCMSVFLGAPSHSSSRLVGDKCNDAGVQIIVLTGSRMENVLSLTNAERGGAGGVSFN